MTKHSILAAAATAMILGLAACDAATTSNETGNAAVAQSDADGLSKLGATRMDVDTSYLSAEEREVAGLLIQAANLMSEIYKRQNTPDYDKVRAEVAAKNDSKLLEKFDAFYGPWDPIEEGKPFFGDKAKPAGAGFYPADLTKEAFDKYLVEHPHYPGTLVTGPSVSPGSSGPTPSCCTPRSGGSGSTPATSSTGWRCASTTRASAWPSRTCTRGAAPAAVRSRPTSPTGTPCRSRTTT